jgi:hypothetical protein
MCPVAHADGHNFPGHVDELVPGEAAVVKSARAFVYNSKAEVISNPFENRITDKEAARTVYAFQPPQACLPSYFI